MAEARLPENAKDATLAAALAAEAAATYVHAAPASRALDSTLKGAEHQGYRTTALPVHFASCCSPARHCTGHRRKEGIG